MKYLVVGGAGFVGSAMARYLVREPSNSSVVVFDNLRRRGSELNIARMLSQGIEFVHGDVRNREDLETLDGTFDVLIEASAEPSVHAGIATSPRYVLDTNLLGTINCLEFARNRCAGFIFLSSSRVYSIEPLVKLSLVDLLTRLELERGNSYESGLSFEGVSERFQCSSYRSYYGGSKLAAEILCQEYAAQAGLRVVINRCGVIAGPGQYGKTDQGVFSLWVARHHFGRPLRYTGFGGKGLQVRDLLHPDDLCDLVGRQLNSWSSVAGQTFNVGGGRAGSVSLQEYTRLCQEATGRTVPIETDPVTKSVDIPWYITDHTKVSELLSWQPRRSPKRIVQDIAQWVAANETALSSIFS